MRSAGRVLGACIPMAAICLWIAGASLWTASGGWILKSAMLFGGIGLSITAYLGVHLVLGSEELDVVLGMVKRKLGRVARKFGAA